MKNSYHHHVSNCAEYNALRAELLERLNFMNTFSYNSITIIIALWVAGFTLVGVRFGILNNDPYINMAFTFGESIAFFMVIPIVHVFVIKNDENIRQIASIGAYVKVFYECIPIVKQEESFCYWEIVDSDINLIKNIHKNKKLKKDDLLKEFLKFVFNPFRNDSFSDFYNLEYFFMMFASGIFWVMSIISYIKAGLPALQIKPINIPTIFFVISIVFFVMCFFQICRSGKVIFKHHNVPKRFNKYYKQSVEICIISAKNLGRISDDEEKKVRKIIDNH